MQTLLDDIELDIQELKCLMQALSVDTNPTLRVVTRRHIQQMCARLEALQKSLDEVPAAETKAPAVITPVVMVPVTPVVSSEPTPPADIQEVVAEVTVIPESVEATPVVIMDTPKPIEQVSLNSVQESPKSAEEAAPEPKHDPQPSASPILAERIKPATDLRHAISLNDSFRFAREIFGGDTARMNEVIRQLGAASSLDEALTLFSSTVQADEENETVADFIELLKKYFS